MHGDGSFDLEFDLHAAQIIKDNGSRGIGRQHKTITGRHVYWDPEGPRKRQLKQRARITGLNWRNQNGIQAPAFDHVRVVAWIAYPPRVKRADPGNLSHTIKPLIDGLTLAGLWPDDDSEHLIGPDYRRDPTTGIQGLWRVRLHIIPLNEKEQQ